VITKAQILPFKEALDRAIDKIETTETDDYILLEYFSSESQFRSDKVYRDGTVEFKVCTVS